MQVIYLWAAHPTGQFAFRSESRDGAEQKDSLPRFLSYPVFRSNRRFFPARVYPSGRAFDPKYLEVSGVGSQQHF